MVQIGDKLTKDCSNLSDWMVGNSFKLNAGKTHFLTMGTKRKLQNLDQPIQVLMDGVILKESKEKKELLLGVVITNDMEWSEQVKALVGKLKQRLGGLEKLKYIMRPEYKKTLLREYLIVYFATASLCLEDATTVMLTHFKFSRTRLPRLSSVCPPGTTGSTCTTS